jgi:hypothetical protein
MDNKTNKNALVSSVSEIEADYANALFIFEFSPIAKCT